ncbi:hypothetical protein [Sphingomonas sp.]|uniref:hypothetical protein n=1 Tax=Sphingomonas sp. TaxID=28214 RepID=UPI0035BBE4DC
MTLDLAAILRHVRALWRRDRAILSPVSALLVFLPQYALLLLVPPMPAGAPGTGVETWAQALEPWIAAYGGWYVAATLVGQYGALAIVSLYAAPTRATGAALARAALLFPRAFLATALVSLPCGVVALIALSIPFAPVVVLPAIVYVLARTVLIGPVVIGERGTGAVTAIARSWRSTRGHGLAIGLLVGAAMVGGQVLGASVIAAEHGVRAGTFANPVLLAMIDAAAAGVAWVAALVLALAQVALYRRLAR